jgi:hypothetical protein
MSIVKEIKKVIAQLPLGKAAILKRWLDEFEAVRRYKKLKAYAMAAKALADFKKSKSNALWN